MRRGFARALLLSLAFLGAPVGGSTLGGLTAAGSSSATAAEVPEPGGYRLSDYRSPVPSTLSGAQVVDTDGAYAIWTRSGAAFIDVLPQAPRPAGLPTDTIWRDKPRDDIPGSIWLPDTGYGALSPAMQVYFESGLARASGGDKAKLLVFYCLADCWQSWNAAKRALALGYAAVIWYREGTTGWEAAGHPLEMRQAEPRPQN